MVALGLGMVARSVQQLNGTLRIESDSGHRMRITVELPLVIDGADDHPPDVA
jgi:chemotaxis protein histidine kinase CheA